MKKITLLMLTLMLSVVTFAQKQAFKAVPFENEAQPVAENIAEAPQALNQVSKNARRVAIASVDDIVGSYTWDYKTSKQRAEDPTTVESTAAKAAVTISKGTEENTIVIKGMFPKDLTATVDLGTGVITIADLTPAGTSSYGDYSLRGLYAQDGKWYYNTSIGMPATVGSDGVITFSEIMWITRKLVGGDYDGQTLTPYYLPGSTLTPSEPLVPVTPPTGITPVEYSMTYTAGGNEASKPIYVIVSGNDVYFQGMSSYIPEAWVKGTKDGNTITFSGHQYMGDYANMTSFFFYTGDATFTYDDVAETYSYTGQIFGVLGEQYYDGNYTNPVLTKVVEKAATPADPTIKAVANGDYGYYITFDIPTKDREGASVIASKLSYLFFVDNEETPLTFTSATHSKLTEDMTVIPYGFTENYDFYNNQIYFNNLYSTSWKKIGLQSIYTGGGEIHKSNIVWFTLREDKDVNIAPESGDITAAIKAVLGTSVNGNHAKNVTITLTPGASYTITEPIVPSATFVIMTAGSMNEGETVQTEYATIDASALSDAFVKMDAEPSVAVDGNGFYPIGDCGFLNVKVTGLKKQLFYANKTKYELDLHFVHSQVLMDGGNATVFDTNGGGVIANLDIAKATIASPATAHTGALYSSQSGQKAIEAGLEKQQIMINRSTIFIIAYSKNVMAHRQNSQTWLYYEATNSIFANVGKNGQTVVGLNGGGVSTNPEWHINHNVFNWGDEDTGAAEVTKTGKKNEEDIVQSNVAGVAIFADPVSGDFNGTFATSATIDEMPGDPRWTLTAVAPKDYSTSINIEKIVLDNGKSYDIAAAFAERFIKAANYNALDSLNDNKGMLRNEAYLGLKFKEQAASFTVSLKRNKALNVKFGYINDAVNVAIDGVDQPELQIPAKTDLSSTTFSLPAAAADREVTFTTTTAKTVVVKQIMIGEAIATVTLPDQVKFEVSAAEGIENGSVSFAAATLTNSKAPWMVEKNDEVTITATPASDDYELESLTVKGVTGNEDVPVTDGKFIMPADAVVVTAVFKEKGGGTGIQTIEANALENAAIYNLQGVRVEKAQKGLYIVNGKKVVLK